MIILPKAARAQSTSPVTTGSFQLPRGARGMRFTLAYLAETNAASTLDCKFQYHVDDSTWSDLVTPAESVVDFAQFTGVATQTLTVYPSGPAEELTTAPTLFALMSMPQQFRAVVTMAGAGGTDTITFSLVGEELY